MLVELVPISNYFKMVRQALHIICKVICNSLEWELQYNVVSWTKHSLLLLSQDLLQIRIRWVKYTPMTCSSKWTFPKFIIIEFILVYRIFYCVEFCIPKPQSAEWSSPFPQRWLCQSCGISKAGTSKRTLDSHICLTTDRFQALFPCHTISIHHTLVWL